MCPVFGDRRSSPYRRTSRDDPLAPTCFLVALWRLAMSMQAYVQIYKCIDRVS